MTYKIYIGTERNQYVTQRVLQYSIDSSASVSVTTIPLHQQFRRVGGTNFGFVRFTVPSMNNFSGRAAYLDADQVVLSDVTKLFELLPQTHAIGLVTKPEGTFGGKIISEGNQTSVMILDCPKLSAWKVPQLFENVVPNRQQLSADQIHYRDFMALKWFDQSQIFSIPPSWNHFNVVQSDSNLVHFSHVRSQPWRDPTHPLSDWWNEWLVKAVNDRYLSRSRLYFEISRGHVDKKFQIKYRRGIFAAQ